MKTLDKDEAKGMFVVMQRVPKKGDPGPVQRARLARLTKQDLVTMPLNRSWETKHRRATTHFTIFNKRDAMTKAYSSALKGRHTFKHTPDELG